MNLCVFQGTFNPIHKAHLRLLNFIEKKYNFDKILVIPAKKPPHKNYDRNLAFHRLEMVKLALKNNPKLEVSDIEYKRDEKSYTYVTICELYKMYDIKGKISFVIGTDAFKNIEKWYKVDELKKLVEFIVFIREDNFNSGDFDYLRNKDFNFKFENLTFEDISSTNLREKIKKGIDTSNYLTKEVEEYIKLNGLYKN